MIATIKKIILLLILAMTASVCSAAELEWNGLIVERIVAEFALEDSTHEIEVLSNPLHTKLDDSCEIALKPLTQKDPVGLFSVLVTVSRQGEIVETGQVRLRIKKYSWVLVVTDRCLRAEAFDPAIISVERMEVTNLREAPLTSLAEVKGMRAKRNLRKGMIVTSGAIEPIPDVESGMETVIVYDDGVCRITAPGVALQSGITGDYIKVKNKATRKIVVARVLDDGAVAIDP